MKRLLDLLHPRRAHNLRDATPKDAGPLSVIHKEVFRRGWDGAEFERLLSDRAVRAHVMSESGTPLGFVLSHVVVPEAEILSLAIRSGRRGQGLGADLLQHHLARLASEGVTTSFLEVEETNAPALGLYRRFGYEVVGRRRGYYEGGAADALMLRRDF